MLIQIDNQFDLWIDTEVIMMLGEDGLERSFSQTRIAEGIKGGRMFDASFRKGKKSLLLYPSGQAVITHVPTTKIHRLIPTQSDELRQLRLDYEVLALKLDKLMKEQGS